MADNTTINVKPNGPYFIEGAFRIVNGEGKEIPIPGGANATALCRCGQSHNKPFCDGTHKKIGFEAP